MTGYQKKFSVSACIKLSSFCRNSPSPWSKVAFWRRFHLYERATRSCSVSHNPALNGKCPKSWALPLALRWAARRADSVLI